MLGDPRTAVWVICCHAGRDHMLTFSSIHNILRALRYGSIFNMATCLKEVERNKKLANTASFIMAHLHRMKVPRKQEHPPRKIQDHTMY